jgi:signal peptidase
MDTLELEAPESAVAAGSVATPAPSAPAEVTAAETATRDASTSRRWTALRVANILATIALFAVIAFMWPQSLGGRVAYVQVSGHSMEPEYHTGDLVVVMRHPSYARGDVIAYHIPHGEVGEGVIVVHRIIGGNAHKGFVTQGDNRTAPDPWHPRPRDVVGTPIFSVAGAGHWLGDLHSPFGLAAIAGLLGAFVSVVVTKPDTSLWRFRAGSIRRSG